MSRPERKIFHYSSQVIMNNLGALKLVNGPQAVHYCAYLSWAKSIKYIKHSRKLGASKSLETVFEAFGVDLRNILRDVEIQHQKPRSTSAAVGAPSTNIQKSLERVKGIEEEIERINLELAQLQIVQETSRAYWT
ncbi:hypothetical protein BXZ70DRAFT_1004231 [Cristinia sonorae]|uniref:Uncharacterized protein n=1 Tax=Cristinia sonorae TaxID=1940300 RepID=A0A8K0UX83_9AGAR|nr:hypothetical protein BXZ70DRAFT_1004231 [Cristinia sonorae]